jgi:hypothetical protein
MSDSGAPPVPALPAGLAAALAAVAPGHAFEYEGQWYTRPVLPPSGPVDQKPAHQKPAVQHRRRSCLRCGIGFPSEGSHNRLCNGCRAWATAEGDYGYEVVR